MLFALYLIVNYAKRIIVTQAKSAVPDGVVSVAHDVLAAVAALERRYDGSIPDGVRLAARLGSAEIVERLVAAGQRAFYRSMVLGQHDIIRRRRAEGSFYPALIDDLRTYRAGWRHWHRRCHDRNAR
jgi:hypothetical protein